MRILSTWIIVLTALPIAAAPTYDDVVVGNVPTIGGGSITLRMDIFKPPGATQPTPVVLWIHGGGWQSGSYNGGPPAFVQPLLQNGISIASIGYRLSSQEIFPAQIHDVKGAVRFLRANAATYGIDPNRMGSWGTSAGGHLSALLATSGGVTSLEGTTGGNPAQSSRILAAVDYFGPTDILNINLDVTTPPGSGINHDAPTSPESKLIGFAGTNEGIGVLRANLSSPNPPFPQKAALAHAVNPITHVDATDPVMFIGHGLNDTSVPLAQSTRLFNALQAASVPVIYRQVPGAGHGFLGDETNAEALAWMIAELTRPLGDANRDGSVDTADFNLLAGGFGAAGGWRQGDFDANGIVNSTDFNYFVQNYGISPSLGAVVPEPLALAAPVMLIARRRRR